MTHDDINDAAATARAKLVQALVDSGDLSDPAWKEAFERVPRHAFVPYFYDHAGNRISSDDPATRDAWFTAVHEDRSLVTHRTNGAATSSSSQPSLMAEMLQALDVADGMRVLEIGTGTGYNAALLAHRLGYDHVVSIDVTPDITTPARERLAATGYRPLIVTGDGSFGWPDRAPYDRIMATCRLDRVPRALVSQLTEGGILLAPLGNGLARIHKTGGSTAEGRFLGGAFFMPLRRGSEDGTPARRPELPTGSGRPSLIPAAAIGDNAFRFLVSVVEPGLTWQYDMDDDQNIIGARVWSGDGSLAHLRPDGTVIETGPRRVWEHLEAEYRLFDESGRPGPDRYGISVDADDQLVWLDHPSGQSWPLRRPATA